MQAAFVWAEATLCRDWDCAQFQLGVVVDHLQSGLFGARSTVTRASFRLGGCLHLS